MVVLGIGRQMTNGLIKAEADDCFVTCVAKELFAELPCDNEPADQNSSNESTENKFVDFEEEMDDCHPTFGSGLKESQQGIIADCLIDYEEQHPLLFHPEATTPPPKA